MRVISVVTLLTPHGEYGGPSRVAFNQASELISRGHDVQVAAGADGFDDPLPRELEGVPVMLRRTRTLVPGTGFAGLIAPGLRAEIAGRADSIDLLHIHLGRDLVTLPIADWARRHQVPYVLQTHGMIDASSHALAAPLDAALTRRVLRGAGAVFHLTDRERADLIGVAGDELALVELPNGTPLPREPSTPDLDRPEVLFLARLAPRKRPTVFIEMARTLSEQFPRARFRLVGPDEGEGAAVRELLASVGDGVDVAWEGPIEPEHVLERMSQAAVYVLPSVDEPYPMTVLEAMSLGVPVVVTDSCGLAPLVHRSGGGFVTDPSTPSLVGAVEKLLRSSDWYTATSAAARDAARRYWSMTSVGDLLEDVYESII